MAKIVALRGFDTGPRPACGCAAPPLGDDSVRAPMNALTMALWIASIGTVGYIFYATLQPKRKRA